MKRLAGVTELLDGPLDDELALVGNLRDLKRINRWLGGVRLSAAGIDALTEAGAGITWLDVGTGGADIPLALLQRARLRGTPCTIVALDSRAEVLSAAALADPEVLTTAGLALRLGDGRSLPFPDGAFDIAHCSLVLHHLDPTQALDLLREMRRVARRGVVVNDLDRSTLGWIGAWLIGHLLTRNRYTRHDAPLSVRRAYRPDEMSDLIRTAGMTSVRTFRGAFGQRYAIAARPTPPASP